MTEENSAPQKGTATPAKKSAVKRKPAGAKATSKAASARKPATRKTTTPKKNSTQDSAAATEQPAVSTKPPADEQPQTSEKTDAQPSGQDYDASNLVDDLKGRDWPKIIQRALLMVFFGFLAWVTISVAFFLASAQVVISIFVGEPNAALTRLIKQGANYIHDVLDYLSFASDECPFPFGRKLPEAD